MHTTSRLGLDVVDGTDNVSAYPVVDAQAKGVLDNAAIYQSGTLAARPAANTVAAGTFYYASDQGQWYVSNGSAWMVVAPPLAAGTFAARPGASVAGRMYQATDTNQLFLDTGSSWISIPSGLAGSSTIGGLADTGGVRVNSWTPAASGVGAEMVYAGGNAAFQGYNRTTSSYVPTQLGGNPVSVVSAFLSATILDSSGNSSYITRAGQVNGKTAIDSGSATFSVAALDATTVGISHGLGRTPAGIQCTGQRDGSNNNISVTFSVDPATFTTTNATIDVVNTQNRTLTNAHFYWLAYG